MAYAPPFDKPLLVSCSHFEVTMSTVPLPVSGATENWSDIYINSPPPQSTLSSTTVPTYFNKPS